MIDTLLLAQMSWCFVWLARKSFQNALVYAGGIVSAGYVAWQTTGWLATWFASTANPAFLWLQQNLNTQSQAVTILTRFVPAQPVDTSMTESHFISLHIARGLVFFVTTLAVFLAFVVIVYLKTAIWDQSPDRSGEDRPMTLPGAAVAAAASLYICLVTMMFLSNIAWLRPLHALVPMVGQSLGLHFYASFIHGH